MTPFHLGGAQRSMAIGLILFLAFVARASATTFLPPDLPRLVAQAERIVEGEVRAVRSYRVAVPGGSAIETETRVAVHATEKGEPIEELALIQLGGQVGDEVLEVDAMPQLTVGERVVLFVAGNGRNVCPLVGWGHGAYRIRRDLSRGRDYVERYDGRPLVSVSEVAQPLAERRVAGASVPAEAVTIAAFRQAIRLERERLSRAR